MGLIHSNEGSSVAKLDIQRAYFTGKVSSAQMTNNAGNAAGILAITQENHSVRMSEVLCLAEEITAHTPNCFYSRRLSNPVYIEHMDKLFVREELQLTYAGDGGVGVQIPAQYIDTLPDAIFRTEAFYREQLSWDMDSVWTLTEGEYPVLRRGRGGETTWSPGVAAAVPYRLLAVAGGVEVCLPGAFSVAVYDLAGQSVARADAANDRTFIPLGVGAYVVRLAAGTAQYAEKVLVR